MTCAFCNVGFQRSRKDPSKSGLRFCSVKCRNSYLSTHQKDRIERVPKKAPPGALYRYIPVGPKTYAIVDQEDYEWLNQWRWHIDAYGYAVRSQKPRLMHRLIMGNPPGLTIDHCKGDKLDNRRSKLRVCNHVENTRNMRIHRDNHSGFKGVAFKNDQPRKKPWAALIMVNRRTFHLGHYSTALEAASAYNEAAIKHFGEFARLNALPEEVPQAAR